MVETADTKAKDNLSAYLKNQLNIIVNETRNIANTTATLRRSTLDNMLGGNRDFNHECGYPDTISVTDYKNMYDREGVSKRVVTIFPEESWMFPPLVYENEDETTTAFEEKLAELDEKKAIFYYLRQADILSGIGRFGIVLLGIGDGKDLKEPVDGINLLTGETVGEPVERELLYLRSFAEDAITIKSREKDQKSPRFGRPVFYTVKMDLEGDGSFTTDVMVHWTRIVHIADNREHSEVYGVPRMQADYNRLLDLKKTLAGSAEMFWKGGFPGYGIEVNPDYSDATLDTESIKDEMESFFNGLQRYMAMEGVTVKSLQPQTSDPTSHIEAQIKAICASRGIPYRTFIGSEKAELASTQDKRSWNERIRDRQSNYLTPMVVRPFIERLMVMGVLPTIEDFIVVWPDRDAPSKKEIAEVGRLQTEAMAKYVAGSVSAIIAPFEFLTMVLGFSDEEARSIEKSVVELEVEQEDLNDDEGNPEDNDENSNGNVGKNKIEGDDQ